MSDDFMGSRSAHFCHNNCNLSFNPHSFPQQLQSTIPPLSLHEGAASFLFVLLWYVDLFCLLLLGVGDVAVLHLTINQLTSTKIFQTSTDFNSLFFRIYSQGCGSASLVNADPDPAFHFNTDPDPAPHQSDGNLRQLVWSSVASVYGSILSL